MDENNFRFFMLNNLAIESAVRAIGKALSVDLGSSHNEPEEVSRAYYPQFSERIRAEAERMAANYVLFYSLENSIRALICDVMIGVPPLDPETLDCD